MQCTHIHVLPLEEINLVCRRPLGESDRAFGGFVCVCLREHRVTQALSLSAMSLEDMLSRQAGLLDLHRQLHQDERQAYQDEIRRLTKSVREICSHLASTRLCAM